MSTSRSESSRRSKRGGKTASPKPSTPKTSGSQSAHFKVNWVKDLASNKKYDNKPGKTGGESEWGRYVSTSGPKNAARKAARSILNAIGTQKIQFQMELINREKDNKYAKNRGTLYVWEASWSPVLKPERKIIGKDGKVLGVIKPMRDVVVKDVDMVKPKK